MYLVVGLGNPGPKYALTRHNIGFLTIDALAQELGLGSFGIEKRAQVVKFKFPESDITGLLAKPQTYMNLSGESVQALMAYYRIEPDKLLIIHDDIDQPFSHLRFQKNRGAGGHNGIRNIHEHIGSDYARLKLGVGRPLVPQMDVVDYVLQNFSDEEQKELPDFISRSCDAAMEFVKEGFLAAQNKYNQKPPPKG